MTNTVKVSCAYCGTVFDKEIREYNRKLREHGDSVKFYCNSKCHGLDRIVIPVEKDVLCPCGIVFTTTTDRKHCSNSCATSYSCTDEKRNRLSIAAKQSSSGFTSDNLDHIANGLRVREWGKYDLMHEWLTNASINHCFEYVLDGSRYVFDLALFDMRTLVEFDEYYHFSNQEEDSIKDKVAIENGWSICRINVCNINPPYPVDLIKFVFDYYS